MLQCCSVPSHASVQHKWQSVGTDTTIQQCPIVNITRQVNQQSVKYLICYILPGTVHTTQSMHSPSCSVNRTNETQCAQYAGDFFSATIPASPLSPIAYHQVEAASQCPADATAGSSWIPPGAQIWVLIQLPIYMKLVKTELASMLQVTREGRWWTQHHVSLVSLARLG